MEEQKHEVKSSVEETRRARKSLADAAERIKKGPTIKVKFMNLEDPPNGDSPTPLVKFFYEGIRYEVTHDDVVEWPVEVVEHINSLSIPRYKDEHDPVTGALRSVPAPKQFRFQCIPVDLTGLSKPGRRKAE